MQVAKRERVNRSHLLIAGTALGATLFANVMARRAKLAHPPLGSFVQGLHFIERGFGEPVVLLHGLGSMLQDFALSGLVTRASREFHVFAFDRPGYGHSARPRSRARTPLAQAQQLHEAFQQLGIARPVIVGHSWGAQVALAYGLEYPQQTRGLVLASGYYYPSVRADAPFLVPPAIPLLGTLLRHTLSPVAARLLWPLWLRLLFSPAPVPSYFARFPTWLALRPEQLRAVGEEAAMLLPLVMRMQREYAHLTVPVCIVAGTHDRYVSTRAHSLRLHRALPQSTFMPVAAAGHMAHHAAPEALMEAIRVAARTLQKPEA